MTITATEVALAALVVFIALLVYLRVPGMVAGMLDARAQAIAKELHDARRLREDAERLFEEHQAKKAAAEAEAAELIAAAKEQAQLVAEETRARMVKAIAQREEQAKERIAQAEAKALAEIRAATIDAAVGAAENMMRAEMSSEMQARLVAEGVAQMARKFG